MMPWRSIKRTSGEADRHFRRALADSAAAQGTQLATLLADHGGTGFGRRYGFSRCADADQFRARVPLQDYEALAPLIAREAAGEGDTLLAAPVLLFEETGGSRGGSKLVPYSEASLAGFRRAVRTWLHDLSGHYPRLGRGYFAISPAARAPRHTATGIPVGAGNDALYFGAEMRAPLASLSVAPPQLAACVEMGQWQQMTLLYLLAAPDLTLISVWSPTFLTSLLQTLPIHTEWLLRQLHDGLTEPLPGAPAIAADPARAAQVARALGRAAVDTRLLWPALQLVSCWTHGASARYIPALRALFPYAQIQGKGLLATEGVVSIPLHGYAFPVLALNSGFYEFLDSGGVSHLAHEVEEGGDYEVVISVPGLWRYRTGDRVRVRGWAGTAPQLEFLGRAGLVSDLVGEKLSDDFVAGCLAGIDGFAMLAPEHSSPPCYSLFVEQPDEALAPRVEQALRKNPQYAYARALGQLGPLQLVSVPDIATRYQAWALARGQRLGDIKPPSLHPEPGWLESIGAR